MTDPEMVRRVAQALAPSAWHPDNAESGVMAGWRERSLSHARDAIRAMREPVEAMGDAACAVTSVLPSVADEAWRVMIDIALGASPSPAPASSGGE